MRVFVRHAAHTLTRDDLLSLFSKYGIISGYFLGNTGLSNVAFLSAEDAAHAVKELHGTEHFGQILDVTLEYRHQTKSRAAVAYLPASCTADDVTQLVSSHGATPFDVSLSLPHAETNTIVATMSFTEPGDAAAVVTSLHGAIFEGNKLHASVIKHKTHNDSFGSPSPPEETIQPLCLLVPCAISDHVLKKNANAFREIADMFQALVTVVMEPFAISPLDRMVIITGQTNVISSVLTRIVLTIEAAAEETGYLSPSTFDELDERLRVPLKVLVPNTIVSHIIGKGGCNIKNIMDISKAKVSIVALDEEFLCVYRVALIAGSEEASVLAASLLHGKITWILNKALPAVPMQQMNMPRAPYYAPRARMPFHPAPMVPPSFRPPVAKNYQFPPQITPINNFDHGFKARPQAAPRPPTRGIEPPQSQSVNAFRSYIMIPESCFGAIIGRQGAVIREIMAKCQAHLLLQKSFDISNVPHPLQRLIVTGTYPAFTLALTIVADIVLSKLSINSRQHGHGIESTEMTIGIPINAELVTAQTIDVVARASSAKIESTKVFIGPQVIVEITGTVPQIQMAGSLFIQPNHAEARPKPTPASSHLPFLHDTLATSHDIQHPQDPSPVSPNHVNVLSPQQYQPTSTDDAVHSSRTTSATTPENVDPAILLIKPLMAL